MTDFKFPVHIGRVLRRLTENGYDSYLVGGGVRDTLMNRQVHDWDIATSAAVEDVARLFDKTVMTGARFGTVTVILPECSVEITTFRTDGEYIDGRRPESVSFTGTLEEDLSRRDFRMNAIAVSKDGRVIDPFNGLQDIENCVIQCVGNPKKRLREDALRMLRAMRFKAELGFIIEPETLSAIYELAPETARLSAQRVKAEAERTLMSERPEILGEMIYAQLFTGRIGRKICPEKLSSIKTLPKDRVIRWCAFCTVLKYFGIIESVTDFTAEKMRLDRKTVRCCTIGAETAVSGFPKERAGIKRLISAHGRSAVRCAAAGHDVLHGGGALSSVDEVLKSGECYTISELSLSGGDLLSAGLGIAPGKALGSLLNALLEHVIKYPDDNNQETLIRISREILQAPGVTV